ncbi:NAD(P)/FAD-dependent oxidoreductase [Shimia sp.]|uniref:NAD(P)/FAD-dependent oxidoreductase n=1 Tax=Shimia sp. TaxID=1954381 RepID=UPI00356977C8
MNRICDAFAYGDGPVEHCFWNETVSARPRPPLTGEITADVAVIGAGYTGLSAALHLAEAGRSVALVEARQPGWGASGRNGGFCCLGGAKAGSGALRRRFGGRAYRDYRLCERDAVDLVAEMIARRGIAAETHSEGETLLAHRRRDFRGFEAEARELHDLYGVSPEIFGPDALARRGMSGPFQGGMTTPIGFALNPAKYAAQLAAAAEDAGAAIYGDSPVTGLTGSDGAFVLQTASGRVSAGKVVIATNGYSSEDLPGWLGARFIPAQSSIMVTRPLTEPELQAQGWTSDQMCYDTRNLLHYFRLMPDRRFLFGMRGGLSTTRAVHHAIRDGMRRDFNRMFPAWAEVETPWYWSGFVCYARGMVPFAAEVPGAPGLFAGFAYHGNGVAMGSYCGALLAQRILGRDALRHPEVLRRPPGRFPGGRFRRLAMWPAYLGYALSDL